MPVSSARPDLDSAPLKVLIVAPAYMVGGQARAAADIVLGFAGDGEITVALQPIDPRLPGRWAFLTDLKFLRTLVRPWIYGGQLLGAARRSELLHVLGAAHTAFLFGAAPAIAVGRLLGRPVVLNYHDGRARMHFRRWGPLLRAMLRRVDRIVVPSGYLQEEFRAQGFEARVVPNVIDTSAYHYRRPEPLRRRLVSTRLLEPLYAVENTINAFALLRPEFPDLVLDIYGGGVSAQPLADHARRLGVEGVTFHGEIPHHAMPEALAGGGIMVNSSRIDNMPHFVLEAFAAGLPIVSTAAGGIPYMIDRDRTGLLVPLDDPAALAAAIRRLLMDGALAERLADAGRLETARYDWASAGAGWRETYRAVAGRKLHHGDSPAKEGAGS